MKKNFFQSNFFFRSISWISAFQRTQARLQGVKTTRTAGKTLSDPPKSANGYGFYKTVFIWIAVQKKAHKVYFEHVFSGYVVKHWFWELL